MTPADLIDRAHRTARELAGGAAAVAILVAPVWLLLGWVLLERRRDGWR